MLPEAKSIKTDFLVIGSGIAGLTFALKTATKFKNAKITIITKDTQSESNTNMLREELHPFMTKLLILLNNILKIL